MSNISSNSDWISPETTANKWQEDSSPSERKGALLRSDMDSDVNPAPGYKDQTQRANNFSIDPQVTKQFEMQTTNMAHDSYYQQIDNIAGGSVD